MKGFSNPNKPEELIAQRRAGGMDKLVCPCVITQAESQIVGAVRGTAPTTRNRQLNSFANFARTLQLMNS